MNSDHKLIYQEEWEGYKSRLLIGCLTGLPIFFLMILFFKLLEWIGRNPGDYFLFFAIPLVIIGAIFAYKLEFKCPRCKKRYRPTWNNLDYDYCVNCGLPIYYGSDRFYDYWGTERGDKLVEEVKAEGERY